MNPGSGWLIAGGSLSLAAAALHVACIFGGPDWYRFLGAGERMARAVERGATMPTLITLGIAGVLSIWSAYAFSGAGLLPRLPLLKLGLIVITSIYLLRGLVMFIPASWWGREDLSSSFILWSSLIVLVYGVAHAVGLWNAWPSLSRHG